jgi:hypothetical protein
MNEGTPTIPAKKITTGRIFLTALVITVVGGVIGFLTCGWLFNWIYTIEPTEVWKYGPGEAPTGKTFVLSWLGDLVLAIILVAVFVKLYEGIPYEGWKKGAKFGFFVWLIGLLPGMFATYIWMNVATAYVIYMLIMGLIVLLIKGAIIGAMCKK